MDFIPYTPKTKTITISHPTGDETTSSKQEAFANFAWTVTSTKKDRHSFEVSVTCETDDRLLYTNIKTGASREGNRHGMNDVRQMEVVKIFHPSDRTWTREVRVYDSHRAPTPLDVEITVNNVTRTPFLAPDAEKAFELIVVDDKKESKSFFIDIELAQKLSPGKLNAIAKRNNQWTIYNTTFDEFQMFADVVYGFRNREYTDDEKRQILHLYNRFEEPTEPMKLTPDIVQFYEKDFLCQTAQKFQYVLDTADVSMELSKNFDGIGERKELEVSRVSMTHELEAKGFKWTIYFYRQKLFNTEYLSIGVICDGGKEPFKTHAKIRVELLGVDGETHSVVFGRENMTHFEATIGCPTFIKWQQFESFGGFVAPSEGDDGHPATFVVEFLDDATVVEEFGGCSDFKLNIEDGDGIHSININKDLLAHTCEYFRAKFFGGFIESKQAESTIPDVNYQQFKLMLDLTYHRSKLITRDIMESFMSCSDRFMSSFVLDWIDGGLREKMIDELNEISNHDKMELARTYTLPLTREEIKFMCSLCSDVEGAKMPDVPYP